MKVGEQVEYNLNTGPRCMPRVECGVIVKESDNYWKIKVINSFGEGVFKSIRKDKVWRKGEKNKLG